jgi:hypothetical protein
MRALSRTASAERVGRWVERAVFVSIVATVPATILHLAIGESTALTLVAALRERLASMPGCLSAQVVALGPRTV